MGVCASRSRGGRSYGGYSEKDAEKFIHKMRLLQQEVNAILKQREEESEEYEREMLLMALKESEWKREKKKLKEEVKNLKKKLEEREDKIRLMEDDQAEIMAARRRREKLLEGESSSSSSVIESCTIGRLLLADRQMREERARRDEAVEKWKMLYLAIKNELDNLIQKTQQGTLYLWRAEEEELMEELQMELKAKDETIQVLKAQIASMEDEEYKKKREMDILRQSWRIMSSNGTSSPTSVVKSRSIHLTKSIIKLAFVN